jgi:DNA-binding response OmpR family regulator
MQAFTIILVEDSRADAGLVRAALDEHGVPGELIVISDGDTAIRFIDTLESDAVNCPDLVIIDLNLPKAPGLAVLRVMRRSVKCSRALPICRKRKTMPQLLAQTAFSGSLCGWRNS